MRDACCGIFAPIKQRKKYAVPGGLEGICAEQNYFACKSLG